MRDRHWKTSWTRATKTDWKKSTCSESFEPSTLPFHLHFLPLSLSLSQTVTPSSLLFLFPSLLYKIHWIALELFGLSKPIEQIADLYGKGALTRPSPCPSFSKTTGISNTEYRLVGQQGNMAHGTHIMVFHQSLKINMIQKKYPLFPPKFPLRIQPNGEDEL